MAYVLSIYQGLETKKCKLKQYKNGQKLLAVLIFINGLSKLKTKAWTFRRFMNMLNEVFSCKCSTKTLLVL